jgi:hypothetical protein
MIHGHMGEASSRGRVANWRLWAGELSCPAELSTKLPRPGGAKLAACSPHYVLTAGCGTALNKLAAARMWPLVLAWIENPALTGRSHPPALQMIGGDDASPVSWLLEN